MTSETTCWYGTAHGPFIRRGLGCGTSEGTTLWGPAECVRCGAMFVEKTWPTEGGS